jgi:hypothetical protein
VALCAIALAGFLLPVLLVTELIDQDQAGRLLFVLAWLAGGIWLLPRLTRWLRRERRAPMLICLGCSALAFGFTLGYVPASQAQSTGLTIKAAPRISKQLFVRVIQGGSGGRSSPAAPYASELYDIIVGYGIDPAVALAFFAHESQFCTVGVCADYDTKNWGAQRRAVKPSRGVGFVPGRTGTFVKFGNWQDGVRDWCELILGRYVGRGLETVEEIVPVYAPSNDGNVPWSYISAVRRMVAAWSGQAIGSIGVEVPSYPTYDGNLHDALVMETFLSAEIDYHPEWAFHKFMLSETQAGRSLGAPVDDSRLIKVAGKLYAVQVFALDTLYTPIADDGETNWGDVRRLSDLLRQLPTNAASPAPTSAPTSPATIPLWMLPKQTTQP